MGLCHWMLKIEGTENLEHRCLKNQHRTIFSLPVQSFIIYEERTNKDTSRSSTKDLQ